MSRFSTPAPSAPNVENSNNFESFIANENTQVAYQRLNYTNQGGVYDGKIVLLINELPQSAAEHLGLWLKAIGNTTFIGSPTAGADGSLSNFKIPGNMTLWFSGATVSYPDGKALQRVGLQPDIVVRPTLKGIQAGKDEVLERAVNYLQRGK